MCVYSVSLVFSLFIYLFFRSFHYSVRYYCTEFSAQISSKLQLQTNWINFVVKKMTWVSEMKQKKFFLYSYFFCFCVFLESRGKYSHSIKIEIAPLQMLLLLLSMDQICLNMVNKTVHDSGKPKNIIQIYSLFFCFVLLLVFPAFGREAWSLHFTQLWIVHSVIALPIWICNQPNVRKNMYIMKIHRWKQIITRKLCVHCVW